MTSPGNGKEDRMTWLTRSANVQWLTLLVLGAVWLLMTAKGQQPPPALTQAMIALVGTLSAGHIVKTSKEENSDKA